MKQLVLLAALVVALSLSACGNTFHGIGADMERMGRNIQETLE